MTSRLLPRHGDCVRLNLRDYYETLTEGLPLFHVYDATYPAHSANARSTGRYAIPGGARGHYYTGSLPDCALWESVLRDIVPQYGEVTLDLAMLRPWNMVELKLRYDVKSLNLTYPPLRSLAADEATRELLRELCACTHGRYPETHDAAVALLSALPDAKAITWQSAQTSAGVVHLFYEPPASIARDLEIVGKPYSLASSRGLAIIDATLARAKLVRVQDEP